MTVLLNSPFTTDLEPTVWTEVDAGAKLAWTAGGRAWFELGSGTWGDPGLRLTTALSRSTFGAYACLVRTTNLGGNGPGIGLSPITNPGS